jgi:tetratricopeptide (TPR) repeat protein
MTDGITYRGGSAIRERRWDVFMSYTRDDTEIAHTLSQAMENRGFRVWFDAKLGPGEPLNAIDDALRSSGAVLVLLSASSLSSQWVSSEVAAALHVLPAESVFPIAVGDVDVRTLPEWLSVRQWLHVRDGEQVDALMEQLVPALETALGDRQGASGRAVVLSDLPRRVPLVGAEDYLQELRGTRSGVSWIIGAPGSGKTQLAREHVFQVRDDLDFIWWESAGARNATEIVKRLRTVETQPAAAGSKQGLIIVDQLDGVVGDVSGLLDYLKYLGHDHRVVVTARDGDKSVPGEGDEGNVIRIGPLSDTAVAEYVDRVAPSIRKDEPATIEQIVRLVGGSPLLLRLVITGVQLPATLEGRELSGGPQSFVRKVVDKAVGKQSEGNRRRIRVLGLCSAMLTTIRTDERFALPDDEALFRWLINSGLCREVGGRTVFVHQVVLDFLRETSPRSSLADAVAYLAPRLPDPAAEETGEILTTVAELTQLSELAWDAHASGHLADLLIWQASVWRVAGEPSRAEPLCRQASRLAADADDPLLRFRVLNLKSALAFDQGRIAEATATERETAELATRELGADHPMALASVANLALSLRALGDLPEAVTLLTEVVERGREVLPAGHPDFAEALGNLAICLRDAGEPEKALRLLEEATEQGVSERRGLQFDQLQAAILTDLARFDEAVAVLTAAVEQQTVSGVSSANDVLLSQANLATVYGRLCRLDEALALQSEVVQQAEVLQGPDHPSTLGARSNYALMLLGAGASEEALDLSTEVLEARMRTLGPDHPDTLETRVVVARALRAHGDHLAAEQMFSGVVPDATLLFGPKHPVTLGAREELALQYQLVGKESQAALSYRELLADLEQEFSPRHPMVDRVRAALEETHA